MKGSNRSSDVQTLDYTLYDELTIATAATNASFFTNTAGKTLQQSNFTTPGKIPQGQRFKLMALSVWVLTRNVAAILTERDVEEVIRGYAVFRLNTIPMWEGHPHDLAAGGGILINDGTAAAIHGIQNGFQSALNLYTFRRPIFIDEQNIELQLQWNPAITLATSAIVRAKMRGVLYRHAA